MANKADDKVKMTTSTSHIATKRGYAEGRVIEPGEQVPANIPVADEDDIAEGWMTPGKVKSAE